MPFDSLVDVSLDDKQALHINCGKETFIIPDVSLSVNIKNIKAFFDTIKKLHELGKTSSSDKIVILSDMPPPVRIAYVGLLAALAVQEGGMNDQGLAFLQMLMVRLDFSSDMRREMNGLLGSISASDFVSLKTRIVQSIPPRGFVGQMHAWDSRSESGLVAGRHEQAEARDIPYDELVLL